jgi:medium-chain acyl-[acyl-carrier-protein] hydrolase
MNVLWGRFLLHIFVHLGHISNFIMTRKEKEMIYQEKVKIGLKDIWKGKEVSNKAILEYLENVAAYHSDSVGYGINTTEQTGLSWLLLDWKVKVIKRPEYGQVLDIHTWSRNIIKCYAYRDFEVYDEKNNLCVIASSKWLLVNNETAKIAKVEQEMADKYHSEIGKMVFEEEIEKIKAPENYETSIIYEIKRKDIDIIGHVHNLYYLDMAYEAMPQEVYQQRPFDKFRISYKKEIKLGETVKCQYAYDENKHFVMIRSEDETILHAIIELEEKESF